MFITNHACKKYMERISNKKEDISYVRKKLINIIQNNKQNTVFEDKSGSYVLIRGIFFIFDKENNTIITLYPSTEKKIISLSKLKEIKLEMEDILAGVCR